MINRSKWCGMKKNKRQQGSSNRLIICVAVPLLFFQAKPENVQQAADNYQLVWSDEFESGRIPDTKNWDFENGFVRNQENQWYQPENAWCENGFLVIEARQENKPNRHFKKNSPDWRESRPMIEITSSSINTKGKHQWKYGRFVMRARIDIRSGLWPAWWTLGIDKPWPNNGEIDIMEYYQNKLLANIACGTSQPNVAQWNTKTLSTDSLGGNKWAKEFHVWRMDWDEKAVQFYLDDVLINQVKVDEMINKDDTGFNPLKQPHYMLLNLAVGGSNGGSFSGTMLPARFEVDYVRVFQKAVH